MAVPRLAEADPFFLLDPEHLADDPRKASSIKGASRQRAHDRRRRARTRRPRRDRMRGGRRVGRAPRQGRRVQRPRARARGGGRVGRRAHGRRHHRARTPGARGGRGADDRARHPRRRDRHARARACGVHGRAGGSCPTCGGTSSPTRRSPRSRCWHVRPDVVAATPTCSCDPRVERARGVERRHDALLRLLGAEPTADRPRLRHHDALELEELDARVVLRVAARRGLQRLVRADVVLRLAQRGDDRLRARRRCGRRRSRRAGA